MKSTPIAASIVETPPSLDRPESSQTTYMDHCRILDHQDIGMMGQFVVEAA